MNFQIALSIFQDRRSASDSFVCLAGWLFRGASVPCSSIIWPHIYSLIPLQYYFSGEFRSFFIFLVAYVYQLPICSNRQTIVRWDKLSPEWSKLVSTSIWSSILLSHSSWAPAKGQHQRIVFPVHRNNRTQSCHDAGLCFRNSQFIWCWFFRLVIDCSIASLWSSFPDSLLPWHSPDVSHRFENKHDTNTANTYIIL